MSFSAKLKVGGKEYRVLSANYGFYQATDPTGRPASVVRGGSISLVVESTGTSELAEWMVDDHAHKDGSIIYTKRDAKGTLKEVKFKEAFMVRHHESFNDGGGAMTESFTLSANSITSGSASFENEWAADK